MIDFISIFNCGIDAETIMNNPFLRFRSSVDRGSGEVSRRAVSDPYRGLKFTITSHGKVQLSGSLHKYFNNEQMNYDDFTYSNLVSTIYDLYKNFGINPQCVFLNNLEFGVNLILPYNPSLVIDSLVTHNYKSFNTEKEWNINYSQAKYDQYMTKLYDKGLQYNLPEKILRYEMKVTRMAYLNKTGIKTLWDLTDPSKLSSLKKVLLENFNDILFWDKTIKTSSLNETEETILTKGCNPKFWQEHLRISGSNAAKKKRRYQELVRRYGTNHYHKIADLITDKWDNLMITDDSTLRLLTDLQRELNSESLRLLTDSREIQSRESLRDLTGLNQIPVNTDVTNFGINTADNDTTYNSLSIELNPVPPVSEQRRCLVTGLDISMQKASSRFLGKNGIKFIYSNQPEVFIQLRKRLSSKWDDAPSEKQIEEIAHSIRNEYHNQRIYYKGAIERVNSIPSLFDNYDLISTRKRVLATQV